MSEVSTIWPRGYSKGCRFFCKNGHRRTASNTFIRKDGRGIECRICQSQEAKRWRARQKERS